MAMVFAVMIICGFENRGKARITRELYFILTLFKLKLSVLLFEGVNFSGT